MEMENKLLTLLIAVKGFLQGKQKISFQDMDYTFYTLFGKISSFPSPYGEIYGYLDVVIDAKEHEFKTISIEYTYEDAIEDLNYMIQKIEQNRIDDLKEEIFLLKLNKIYNQ